MALIHSAAAIVTAFRDGADLVLALKDRRWACGVAQVCPREQHQLDVLEMALAHGSDQVQSLYERDSRRIGEAFALGDEIARDALQAVLVDLQKRLMSRLKIAWQQDTHVDVDPLLEVAEDIQGQAIMCMIHLQERLLAQLDIPVMERPRFKPRTKHASVLEIDPRLAAAALPHELIAATPPPPSSSHLFGNHVEISGPSHPVTEHWITTAPASPPPYPAARHPSMAPEPRIQHPPSMTSGYIPIEFHDHDSQQLGAWPALPKPFPAPDHRFADSPTLSPARISSIDSMSSAGSYDFDDPEYNPWSSNGTGSPISSYNGSASPLKSPYAPSLMPEALAPRRSAGETHDIVPPLPSDPRLMEGFQGLTLGPQHRNDSFGSHGARPSPPAWGGDDASVYSQPDRQQSQSPGNQSCLSYYYKATSPTDSTRAEYFQAQFPAPPSAPEHPRPSPTYSWLPPKSPVRQFVRPREVPQPMPSPPPQPHRQPPNIPLPRLPSRESAQPPLPMDAATAPRRSREPVGFPLREPLHPVRREPSYLPQEQVIPANITAYKWEVPRSPPQPTVEPVPIPPRRAPERDSRSPTRPSTMNSSSSGGSVVILPPVTPNSHASFHLANKRVSTVSSSNSSASGGLRQPPVPMPAMRTIPSAAPPGNAKACMPNEKNKYAGFCKSAWRGQIGDLKKAYEERSRPAAISTNKILTYYKCKKCSFEGRAKRVPGAKNSVPDDKVYGSNGILYRWEFLFKSHIETKTQGSPLDAHYGCMFCCATGRGTPIFTGVASLMNHLQEHRDVLPQGEVLYRMNAIVGRSPDPEEDFDIALPSLVI